MYAVNHTYLVVSINQLEYCLIKFELRNMFFENVCRIDHAAYIRDNLMVIIKPSIAMSLYTIALRGQ